MTFILFLTISGTIFYNIWLHIEKCRQFLNEPQIMIFLYQHRFQTCGIRQEQIIRTLRYTLYPYKRRAFILSISFSNISDVGFNEAFYIIVFPQSTNLKLTQNRCIFFGQLNPEIAVYKL